MPGNIRRAACVTLDPMLKRCLAALALTAAPAFAEPPKAPKIEGTFGFDVIKSETTRCAKVAGALLTKLSKNYRCAAPDGDGKAYSGGAIVATCDAKKGHSEYLLFTTLHDCEEERLTEVANGN